MRPRGNGKRFIPRNYAVESNGPDVKVRGTAQQVLERYLALARDATAAGDRVAAEGFYQYADHYHRVANSEHGTHHNGHGRHDQRPFQQPNDSQNQTQDGNGPQPGNGGESSHSVNTGNPGASAPPDENEPPPA